MKIFTNQFLPDFKSRRTKIGVMLCAIIALWTIMHGISFNTERTATARQSTAPNKRAAIKELPAKSNPSKARGDTLTNSDWYSNVMKSIEKAEYKFTKIDSLGKYSSPNRKNNMRFYYDDNGFSVAPRTTKIPVGKPDPKKQPHEREYKTIADWKVDFLVDKKQIGEGRWSVQDQKAEYITDNITIQYVNGEDGMRQNFIVKKPLTGSEELKIIFTVKTKLEQRFSSDRLSFIHPLEGAVLNYDGLKVWDAKGKELAAQFEKDGEVYSIHVNALNATYPVTIDPISTTPSTSIESDQANAQLGYSVDGAGDVNKDGFGDIIVGAPYYDAGELDEGAVFMFYGSTQGINTATGTPTVQSNQAGALAGFSVSGAGDVNGDGYDDVIMGLPYYEIGQADEGLAWLIYGSGTGLNTGNVIGIQFDQANSQLGWAVDGAGDVNGDGFDDIIVGAPNYDVAHPDMGLIFVGHGKSSPGLVSGFVYNGSQEGGKLGWSVAGIGDFNFDGFADIGTGAPLTDGWEVDEGYYIWFMGSSQGIKFTNTKYQKFGGQANCQMGYSISAAGDLNHDGFDEIMIGAPFYDNTKVDEGKVVVWYGTYEPPTINPSYFGGQDDAHFGMSLAFVGDVNLDGYGDIMIGAPDYDNGQANEGAAFLYTGSGGYPNPGEIFESNQAGSKFGQSMAGRVDLNGDGNPDLIIGASHYENGQTDEGTVFVYYGLSNPQHVDMNIAAESNQAGSFTGFSVSGAGDVNGDGYSDVIVGAPLYDKGQVDEGVAFVYYGSATGINTASPVILENNQGGSNFGWAVSTAGDVNGDGYSDVIIGAPIWTNGEVWEGAAFIFHGSASGIATTPNATMERDISSIRIGTAVASAGDINGDGFSDLIVGAPNYTFANTNEGAVLIYYGSASGVVTTSPTIFASGQEGAFFGHSVAGAGDVNGDGYSDVIAGAPYYDNGEADEGIVRLYYGSATGVSPSYVTLEANFAGASFGLSASGAGDVNGDGYSDVVVGSPVFGNNYTWEGAFYLFLGAPSGINTTPSIGIESNGHYAYLGGSISGAGDLNGDGFADVVVGANIYSNGQIEEGAAYIYMGSPAGLSSVPAKIVETNRVSAFVTSVSSAGDVNGDGYTDLIFGHHGLDNPEENEGGISMLYGSADVIATHYSDKLEYNQADARLGSSVAMAGDVNGDGFSDVIVGAPQFDFGQYNEGIASVYLGTANGLSGVPTTLQKNQESSGFGTSVASAGDVNGDGYDDVIVGAPSYNNGEAVEGAAFIYYGSNAGIINAPVLLEKNQAVSLLGFAVASAGDVNGDGYDDVLVGSIFFSNGQSGEGAAFLYLGSASGISTSSAAMLEMNQAGAGFGSSLSSAGDVNGDGFADVIIGAYQYDNGQSNEGAAFIFHGSASGLNLIPALTLEANQADAGFGTALACAGDVNGDGFSDVIIGAATYDDGEADEGNVFIYHGSAVGISSSPNQVLQINQAGANFGNSVSGAGDINGDGYSDVIAGAFYYTAPELYEGAALIFLGSPTGITADVAKLLESNQAGAQLGTSVTGGGDINGDGFGDIMIGASRYADGQTDEGMVFIHYGNAAKNFKRNNLDLYNTDLINPVSSTNFSNTQFGAGLFAKSFMGRDKGKLVWETKQSTAPYNGSPVANSGAFTSQQSSYTDLGLSGIELKNVVNKLPGRYTKVRVRVKYNPATAIKGQLYGPWRYVPDAVLGTSAALPVDLISFGAAWQQQGQVASIIFTTQNESAIDHYEIEKSTNGRTFIKLTKITADNTPELHQYSYIDSNATARQQYYRLRTIHSTGSSDYSRMVVLSDNKKAEILLYPNPATDVVNLKMGNRNGNVHLQVINSSGQTVKRFSDSSVSDRIQVPIKDLSTGVYHLHVQNDGKVEVLKFVKP